MKGKNSIQSFSCNFSVSGNDISIYHYIETISCFIRALNSAYYPVAINIWSVSCHHLNFNTKASSKRDLHCCFFFNLQADYPRLTYEAKHNKNSPLKLVWRIFIEMRESSALLEAHKSLSERFIEVDKKNRFEDMRLDTYKKVVDKEAGFISTQIRE